MPWNQIFLKKGCWIPYLWVPWTVQKIYRKKTLLLGNAQNALPKRRLRKWILKPFFFFCHVKHKYHIISQLSWSYDAVQYVKTKRFAICIVAKSILVSQIARKIYKPNLCSNTKMYNKNQWCLDLSMMAIACTKCFEKN